jgi:Conjugal transfer protein TraD
VKFMNANGNLSNGNGTGEHSREQGLRLHHLANLGGLIAIAGLDLEPPDFLLGALLSVAEESRNLSQAQRAQVAAMGRRQLDARATGKRAWKSWQRAKDLHAITLSTSQVRDIIEVLGGHAPENPARLVLALGQALAEASDETD